LRLLTIVNIVLWVVLFIAWIPYTALMGAADPTSVEVRWILVVSAALLGLLGLVRVRKGRPVLG
jgi:membrane associated rhomboid family serine protease